MIDHLLNMLKGIDSVADVLQEVCTLSVYSLLWPPMAFLHEMVQIYRQERVAGPQETDADMFYYSGLVVHESFASEDLKPCLFGFGEARPGMNSQMILQDLLDIDLLFLAKR
jgi:hypothetical protein